VLGVDVNELALLQNRFTESVLNSMLLKYGNKENINHLDINENILSVDRESLPLIVSTTVYVISVLIKDSNGLYQQKQFKLMWFFKDIFRNMDILKHLVWRVKTTENNVQILKSAVCKLLLKVAMYNP
jgi:hypothetical protein